MEVPWDRLGIPQQYRQALTSEAPVKARMAAAKGLLPVAPAVQLAMFYVLLGDQDARVVKAAEASFAQMPENTVVTALNQKSHPKVLEYLVETRLEERSMMERVLEIRACNDRTVRRIARHADELLCETMSRNQERLLLTPEVFLDLRGNPNCAVAWVEKMEGFLRMQGALPDEPSEPPPPEPQAPEAEPVVASALAEVEAALSGQVSPSKYADPRLGEELELFDLDFLGDDVALGDPDIDPMLAGFKLDFEDEAQEFSWDLLQESEDAQPADAEKHRSMEQIISSLSVGQKIKLAYLGNAEARRILIRERNKMVSGAVVKSGRMNEREVENAAGNRNLDTEVIREMSRNRDYMRKYSVKRALANNPKTPVSVATGLLKFMQFKDLKDLSTNKNISSVIQTQAKRLVASKKNR